MNSKMKAVIMKPYVLKFSFNINISCIGFKNVIHLNLYRYIKYKI